ncbi:MAG: hypothetical protein M0R77_19520 [Gammaproteobacteria bacterium]|nr:hypothetical protein [Gammaproteobacteria bacterium]
MADEKPINSKPFSTSFSFNSQTTTNLSDVSSRQITTDISYSTYSTPSITTPSAGRLSIDNLLSTTSPTSSSSSSLLRSLPVSSDISNITSLVIPQSTPLSSYLDNNTQFISKPLSLLPNSILSSTSLGADLQDTSIGSDLVEAQTTGEENTPQDITNYLNNLALNQLNDYDQATYHLKLFLVKSELVLNRVGSIDQLLESTPDLFSDENIIVIAESGITAGLYIESFSVNNIFSIGPQLNSSGVGAKMVLKEPFGANFIDYYNGAIDELGYETRIQAPIFLEITFRGYDENGNYMNVDDIGNKIYRFTLTNIDAKFLSSGTEYDLDFIVTSDIARQMAIASTSNNITVQGTTVKDFFDKLVEEWNKAGKDIEQDESQPPAPTSGTSGAVPSGNSDTSALPATDNQEKPTPTEKNEFAIIIDDKCTELKDCLSWEVGKASAPDRLRTANTTFESGNGTVEATWASGSDRVGILIDILYSTTNVQTLIVNGKQDSEVKPGSKDLGGTSYIPEIDVNVEQTTYNSETHTYNKKITYIVQERRTTQIASTPKEINDAANDEKALINKLQYVRRRYDYFGTGKNTEILNFNIRVNTDLLINLPAYNAQKRPSVADNPGTGSDEIQAKQVADGNKVQSSEGVKKPAPVNPDNTSTALSADPTSGSETSVVNQSSDIVVNLSSSSILNGPSIQSSQAFDTSFGIDSQLSAQLASYSSLSKPLDSLSLTASVSPLDLISFQTTGTLQYGANSNYITSIANDPISRANDTSSLGKRYLEDFSRIKPDSPKGDTTYQRAIISTDIKNRGGYNLDDSSGLGKSYITALLGHFYGVRHDMNAVTMEVRGDPLWLGVRNKASRDQLGGMVLKDKDGNELPPSDQKILLTVVFPNQYDENTGLAIPNKLSEGYTAFYNVRTVTSTFEGGKFTQTLDMIQDNSTEQVRKYIDPAGSADI